MEVQAVASDAGRREPPTVQLAETLKLPPPPCWSHSAPRAMLNGGFYVPLPLRTFQSSVRSSPRNSTRLGKKDDPFFAAYLECTKRLSWEQGKASRERKKNQSGKMMGGIGLSCKYDCGVGEDSVVTVAKLPALPASKRYLERSFRRNTFHA